jgi:arylsulfatase A-like enzyme
MHHFNQLKVALTVAGLLLIPMASLLTADTLTSKPNILWINMDDVGVEMPCYGNKLIQTPNIDRLVSEGTMFTHAFLTAPVCSTSRSAMITGMYHTTIGANNHVSGRGAHRIVLPADVEPVPSIFKRAGFYTCNGNYPVKSETLGKTDYNFEWDKKIYDGNDWADRRPGQPFFAQIQLWGGKKRNDDGRWYQFEAPQDLGELTKPDKVTLPPYYPRDPILLEDWAQYLDCIRLCDKQVGEILQRLETEGILDQTLIVLMGDNGISHARGKQFLYDEGIRTPFIVRGPGIARGSVRPDLIEHIDMPAISLACAGIKVPPWMQGRDIFSSDYQSRSAVFAARDRCGETVDRIRSVRTKDFKYIRNFYPDRPLLQPSNYKDTKPVVMRLKELHAAGELNALQNELLFAPSRPSEELYDVVNDPFETVNLASSPQYATIIGELRASLDQWSRDTKDPAPEPAELYDLEMQSQVARTKDPGEKDKVLQNVALMKRWETERPLQMELQTPGKETSR